MDASDALAKCVALLRETTTVAKLNFDLPMNLAGREHAREIYTRWKTRNERRHATTPSRPSSVN